MSKAASVNTAAEIRLGPITLYHEPGPELPSLKEQAKEVADFMLSVEKLLGIDTNLERFTRLRAGDIQAAYRQYSQEEIDVEKQQLTFQTPDGVQMLYDEGILNKRLLPIEQQLATDYLNAKAQLWATEHGKEISWSTWNNIRRNCRGIKQGQVTDTQKAKSQPESAKDHAYRLIRAALEEGGHSRLEISGLEAVLAKEVFLLGRVAHPIHHHLPWQLPERVPSWAWQGGLHVAVDGWWLIEVAEALTELPLGTYALPSARPMMMADRAFRTPLVWLQSEELPVYREKKNPGIMLRYLPEGKTSSEEVRKALQTLDPRTSDVWHLLLAKALENGQSQVYQPVEIDVRQFARALGYKPHHKGGMKPRDIDEVARAMEHISSVWITVTPAENTTIEVGTGSGRKGKRLIETTEQRLLAIMERREQRDLFGQSRHLVWEVALGKWAHLFPSSYAPVFKSLVDLPARGRDLWAKQLGKELSFWYREDRMADEGDPNRRRQVKRIRVQSLLERACLLHEVQQMRDQGNRKRPREYFEAAMDKLHELHVVEGWEYDAEQITALEKMANKPGAIDAWLQVNVAVTAPLQLIEALPPLPQKSKKSRRPPPT